MTKRCRICGEMKDERCFRLCHNSNDKRKPGAKSFFRRTECSGCEAILKRHNYEQNREKRLEHKKKYRETHKKELSNSWKRYYAQHKEELSAKNKKWMAEHPDASRKSYAKHRDEYRRKQKERLQTDPIFAFRRRQQGRIWAVFKSFGKKKDDSTANLVGCSSEELFSHLVKTFEKNYNCKWDDKYISEVHIDHIIPISSAKTLEEAKKLFNYTNLQLLKSKDNLSKSNKMPARQGRAIKASQARRSK